MHARRLLQLVFILTISAAVLSFTADSFAASENGDKAAAGEGHETPGLPGAKTDLVLISCITFGLFIFVLKKVAWAPLVEGLDNRESKYRKLLADAQQDRDKAVTLLEDYEARLKSAQAEVDEIIAEARRDAERTKTDIVAAAQQEAETTRNRALEDIERARDQAVSELFDHMRSSVVAATEQVLSRSLNDDDHQRLVDEALAQVSGS